MKMLLHPLLLLVVLTIGSLIVAHALDEETVNARVDPIMLTTTVIAYALAVGVILTRTKLRLWTFLGAGMVATFTADAMLYMYLLHGRSDYDFPVGNFWYGMFESPWWLNTVRALLRVGAPFVLIGLLLEWRVERDQRRHVLEPMDPDAA